ncbi:MAG: SulP family inorganic anion transporter [Thermomicrobiales bacterium]
MQSLHAPGGARSFSLPKIGKGDIFAAITTGIANVQDGMASAMLAGINPVHGIYTLIIGTPIASATLSTQLMMVNTTSAMTLVAVDGLGSLTRADRTAAMLAIALVAGAVQITLGLLRMGSLTKFVSNAVMTGFLTGIATRIILGQLWDLTGYSDNLGGPLLEKSARLLSHLGAVDPWTTTIGLGSLALMLALGKTKLGDFNLLIALIVAAVVAKACTPSSVELVSNLGPIPRSLPGFAMPRVDMLREMVFPGLAVALVGLLQAAGVAQAYPNPDGSETSDSRDFMAQGFGNAAGAFFSSMAGGGSLSGTALSVSAGAQSRWAGILQAAVVLVMVLVFGDLLGLVPFAALAALLIYAAALSIKPEKIRTVANTSMTSLLAMAATYIATLVVPLQQAVLFGVILSAVLFVWKTSGDVRVVELGIEDGRMTVAPPPAELRPNDVTLLQVEGNLFYAGARTLGDVLPNARGVERPVVVLGLRGVQDAGSTFFAELKAYLRQVRESGGRLLLSGVEEPVMKRLERTNMTEVIGPENIFPAGTVVGESAFAALQTGESWLAGEAEAAAASGSQRWRVTYVVTARPDGTYEIAYPSMPGCVGEAGSAGEVGPAAAALWERCARRG